MKLIGYARLLHFRLQLAIGRVAMDVAFRYGAVGIGGGFAAAEREAKIRARHGIAWPARSISGAVNTNT